MAIPGILMQIARSNPKMMQIKQMAGMIRSARDPQSMINQLMMSNPNLKQVMEIVNQYGGDSMRALTTIAKENGIDPNDILNMMNF